MHSGERKYLKKQECRFVILRPAVCPRMVGRLRKDSPAANRREPSRQATAWRSSGAGLASLSRLTTEKPMSCCRTGTFSGLGAGKSFGTGRTRDGKLARMRAPSQTERPERTHCNFAYSALACFRMGMSGSASFQRARKSWYAAFARARYQEAASG
jgi:hypothetical protein